MVIDEVTAIDVSLGEVRAVTPVERRAVISHNCQCTICSDISILFDTSASYLSFQDHQIMSDLYRILLFSLFWYGNTAVYCNILQYTVVYCNILQYTAVSCNILQYTAIYFELINK
jgi:hypothetical protein